VDTTLELPGMVEPAGARRSHLLLVEDDEAVAQMYAMQLEAAGYLVTVALTGEQALHLAQADAPDLIYLDIGLPEMSGLDVLERLRSVPDTAAIPVVVLTNFSEPELIERSRSLGVKDYLIKAHTTPARLSKETGRWAVGGGYAAASPLPETSS
jgi:CheY-like chemotaxis protein